MTGGTRNWESKLISEDDFFGEWGASVRVDGDMFFFDDVKDQPVNHVWSITDSGGERPDHWIAAPGFHLVNVLGYVTTRQPWGDDTPDAFYSFDDFDWIDAAETEGEL